MKNYQTSKTLAKQVLIVNATLYNNGATVYPLLKINCKLQSEKEENKSAVKC